MKTLKTALKYHVVAGDLGSSALDGVNDSLHGNGQMQSSRQMSR
jgi:hypothetical protein